MNIENLVKKVGENNLRWAIAGKFLVILSLGSIFSINLVQYNYAFLITSAIILIAYISDTLTKRHRNIEISYTSYMAGYIGIALVVLCLGIQSPQLPFKIYLLIIGFLLVVPSLRDIIKN